MKYLDMECQLCGAMVKERTRIHLQEEHPNSMRLVCASCAERYVARGQAILVNANGQPMTR